MISELFKIRYLLIFELSLLILFSIIDIIPFVLILCLIVLTIILFLSFDSPVIMVQVLMFSILADSLITVGKKTTGPSLLMVEAFLFLTFVFAIIKLVSNLDKKINVPNLILLWIPFLMWALIGLFIGVDKLRVISYWKNYFAGFFILSFTYFAVKNELQLKSLLLGIIIWGIILVLLEVRVLIELGGFTSGIVGLFLKKNLLTLGWGRSNYLAAFFVIIIPLNIGYLFYTKSHRLKIFLITALILMSFGIILTLSRGGILALIIGLIILFSRILKAKTFLPFFIVILILLIVILVNPLTYVLIERISSFESSGSVYSRINFYQDIWKAFLRHPITGVGMGNLSYYATFILPPEESPSAHNIILGALGETGIAGAILYFCILGTLFFQVYTNYRNETDEHFKILRWSCFSSLTGGLINTLVEPTLDGLQFSIIFWILAAVYLKLSLLKSSVIKE